MARMENGIYVVSDKFTVNRYSLEGTIDNTIKELESVRRMAVDMGMVGEGGLDISILRGNWPGDDEIEITYYFTRPENEKEKAIREKVEAKLKDEAAKKHKVAAEKKKLKTDAEYAEFLRLKEKFGAL